MNRHHLPAVVRYGRIPDFVRVRCIGRFMTNYPNDSRMKPESLVDRKLLVVRKYLEEGYEL